MILWVKVFVVGEEPCIRLVSSAGPNPNPFALGPDSISHFEFRGDNQRPSVKSHVAVRAQTQNILGDIWTIVRASEWFDVTCLGVEPTA